MRLLAKSIVCAVHWWAATIALLEMCRVLRLQSVWLTTDRFGMDGPGFGARMVCGHASSEHVDGAFGPAIGATWWALGFGGLAGVVVPVLFAYPELAPVGGG